MEEHRPAVVTPAGVRDGDPSALDGLIARRGPAVLAYCEHVCAPGSAVQAAAESFARFRVAVVDAEDLGQLDPEAALISATRNAAAVRTPPPEPAGGLAARLAGRRHSRACELMPALLLARVEGELSDADRQRLREHLARCAGCRASEERFRAAEAGYREASAADVPEDARQAIARALEGAAPVVAMPQANGNGSLAPTAHSPQVEEPPAVIEEPPIVEQPLAADEPPPVEDPPQRLDEDAGEVAGAPSDPEPATTHTRMRSALAYAGRPGASVPRRRRGEEGARSHGPAWGVLLPGLVLVGALVVALAIAGVFSGGGHTARTSTPPPLSATPRPLAVHAAAGTRAHRRHARRVTTHRAASGARTPATSTPASSGTTGSHSG